MPVNVESNRSGALKWGIFVRTGETMQTNVDQHHSSI